MPKERYKDSHLLPGIGIRYNKIYYKDTYDSRIWLLEKEILEHKIQKYFKSKINNYLDFASGTGRVLEVFEKKVKNSFGIDISEEMLKEAKKKFKKTKFIVGDLTKNQDLFKEKFDLITGFRFFLNAEESLRKDAFQALYKILKDNGILIFNIHGNKYSIRYLSQLIRRIFGGSRLKELSYPQLKILVKENNFKIIELYGVGFLPIIFTHLLPKRIWLILERIIVKLKFLNIFGINLIFICKKIL